MAECQPNLLEIADAVDSLVSAAVQIAKPVDDGDHSAYQCSAISDSFRFHIVKLTRLATYMNTRPIGCPAAFNYNTIKSKFSFSLVKSNLGHCGGNVTN